MVRYALYFILLAASGCTFFGEHKFPEQEDASGDGVLGLPLGDKAGGPDEAALADLYNTKSDIPPAPIRPDPDLFARQRLREFHDESKTVAKLIGNIEPYRALLGGASEDFRTVPAENYDATSLLAMQKVAEEICTSLVAPNGDDHPGWATILPASPDKIHENLVALAQRITGLPSDRISDATITLLSDILSKEDNGNATLEAYVAPCVALMVDASTLLF